MNKAEQNCPRCNQRATGPAPRTRCERSRYNNRPGVIIATATASRIDAQSASGTCYNAAIQERNDCQPTANTKAPAFKKKETGPRRLRLTPARESRSAADLIRQQTSPGSAARDNGRRLNNIATAPPQNEKPDDSDLVQAVVIAGAARSSKKPVLTHCSPHKFYCAAHDDCNHAAPDFRRTCP